jgi:hypothetical protein
MWVLDIKKRSGGVRHGEFLAQPPRLPVWRSGEQIDRRRWIPISAEEVEPFDSPAEKWRKIISEEVPPRLREADLDEGKRIGTRNVQVAKPHVGTNAWSIVKHTNIMIPRHEYPFNMPSVTSKIVREDIAPRLSHFTQLANKSMIGQITCYHDRIDESLPEIPESPAECERRCAIRDMRVAQNPNHKFRLRRQDSASQFRNSECP